MSEPFQVDTESKSSQDWGKTKANLQDKAQKVWNTVWKQNLRVARKGEAALQLPLLVVIIAGVAFPHLAAVALLAGLIFGYSFTVDGR